MAPTLPADAGRVSVIVKYTDKQFTLCSLTPGKMEQQTLDLTFVEGEEVTFMTVGSEVAVDLTGNYIIDLDDEMGDDEEDLMDDEEMMQGQGTCDFNFFF